MRGRIKATQEDIEIIKEKIHAIIDMLSKYNPSSLHKLFCLFCYTPKKIQALSFVHRNEFDIFKTWYANMTQDLNSLNREATANLKFALNKLHSREPYISEVIMDLQNTMSSLDSIKMLISSDLFDIEWNSFATFIKYFRMPKEQDYGTLSY